jgi:hypothetical protein
MRPYDEDGDGKFDEDGPEDIDGDGRITGYYVYYDNETDGTFEYQYQFTEGLDNDGDGLINEDRIGGVDINRNYPFHWNDSSTDSGWGNDMSDRSWPGPEPASENETRALIEFVSKHNFTHALSLHSGTNITLFDWSYTNEAHQPESSLYNEMLIDFKARYLLPESFFSEENELDYTVAGGWGDWTYAAQHTIPLTLEIYHKNGTEYISYVSREGSYYTYEQKAMFEYFNPPEDKIEFLHQDLFGFEEYWISLTPWIKFLSIENQSASNSYLLNIKIKSGSWYFNSTDRPIVSVIPSIDSINIDFPISLDPVQPRQVSELTIKVDKEIPEGFYLDINISSQWAADLQLRVIVETSPDEQVIGFEGVVILLSLIITIPMVRNLKKKLY